jgi:hypothetical protein
VKGAYKKRGRRYASREGGSHHAYKRYSRRNRRLAVVVLVVFALLALMVADYLTGESELLRGFGEPEVSVEEAVEPAVSEEEEAASEGGGASPNPTVLLGEFFTDYAWDPDPGRQSNLKMASEAIDGTLLAPGETFSAIAVLEPVEYKPAKVFASGGVDYTEGGGLCQVSSTLYMAANYAGLEIVDRNPHYAELPYIRPGFDATVWFGENGWGALDMQFKNNTDGYIRLRQHVNEDGFMIAQVYGEKPTGRTVSMDSEKVEENLNRGIKWATYKKVTDNGRVVYDDLLYETRYSYNPPTPPEIKHETYEPRGSGWVDPGNTTDWNEKD